MDHRPSKRSDFLGWHWEKLSMKKSVDFQSRHGLVMVNQACRMGIATPEQIDM